MFHCHLLIPHLCFFSLLQHWNTCLDGYRMLFEHEIYDHMHWSVNGSAKHATGHKRPNQTFFFHHFSSEIYVFCVSFVSPIYFFLGSSNFDACMSIVFFVAAWICRFYKKNKCGNISRIPFAFAVSPWKTQLCAKRMIFSNSWIHFSKFQPSNSSVGPVSIAAAYLSNVMCTFGYKCSAILGNCSI